MVMRSVLLAGLIPGMAIAQMPTLAPGTRVRVLAPSVSRNHVFATLDRSTVDSLWLTRVVSTGGLRTKLVAERMTLPDSLVAEIRVNQGKNRWKSAKTHALVFGAGAFVLGLVAASGDPPEGGPTIGAPVVGAVFGLMALPVGALTGAVFAGDRWERVYPR